MLISIFTLYPYLLNIIDLLIHFVFIDKDKRIQCYLVYFPSSVLHEHPIAIYMNLCFTVFMNRDIYGYINLYKYLLMNMPVKIYV